MDSPSILGTSQTSGASPTRIVYETQDPVEENVDDPLHENEETNYIVVDPSKLQSSPTVEQNGVQDIFESEDETEDESQDGDAEKKDKNDDKAAEEEPTEEEEERTEEEEEEAPEEEEETTEEEEEEEEEEAPEEEETEEEEEEEEAPAAEEGRPGNDAEQQTGEQERIRVQEVQEVQDEGRGPEVQDEGRGQEVQDEGRGREERQQQQQPSKGQEEETGHDEPGPSNTIDVNNSSVVDQNIKKCQLEINKAIFALEKLRKVIH